jgi:hypothetical protein
MAPLLHLTSAAIEELPMRKRVAVVLAGSLGVVGLVGCDDAGDSSASTGEKVERSIDRAGDAIARGAEKTGEALDKAADKTAAAVGKGVDQASELGRRAGDKASDWIDANVSDAARIRDTLASTAEAALTRDRLNDLVSRLAEADRTRIGQVDDAAAAELNQRAERLRSQWQAKYNAALNTEDKSAIFESARITTISGAGGRKQANVVLPSVRGMPELNLALVNEGSSLDAWRIDVPDSLTAETLQSQLTAEVKKLEEFSAAWPEDVAEARRLVVHHVLSPLATTAAAPGGATASR